MSDTGTYDPAASTDRRQTDTVAPFKPPHDLEAEQAVLGAILMSDRAMYGLIVDQGLKPADFYRERHAVVYQAMLDLHNAGSGVEAITVIDRLRQDGKLEQAGGEQTIEELHALVPSVARAAEYARIVVRHSQLRRLLQLTYTMQSTMIGGSGDPDELAAEAERELLAITVGENKRQVKPIGDVLHAGLDHLQKMSAEKRALTGTPSGFQDLDELTGGFQPGNLIIIAARPSMGKSALVCNICENAALKGSPVLLHSLEMSEMELVQRIVASQTRIPGDMLRKGRIEERKWPRILSAAQSLSEAPLYVDDSSDLGLVELRAKAVRLHSQIDGGLGLVVIDYLQLMRTESKYDNRVVAIGEISRGLKILAGELGVPVIALSQLSRAVEQRPDKRPQLSDLRESGNLEQDADIVAFIYRDDYYDENSDRLGEADLIIAKHRNGPIDTITLAFNKEIPKFNSYASPKRHDHHPAPPDTAPTPVPAKKEVPF